MRTLMNTARALGAAAAIAVALTGCGDTSKAPGPATPGPTAPATPAATPASGSVSAVKITDKSRKTAKRLFAERCSTCHGETGHGDGPNSAPLNPKPRNYHDGAWQASVTDAHIEETILKGGAAVGKSPLMQPNPDLTDSPDVVAALREIVREFGKHPDPVAATGTATPDAPK